MAAVSKSGLFINTSLKTMKKIRSPQEGKTCTSVDRLLYQILCIMP